MASLVIKGTVLSFTGGLSSAFPFVLDVLVEFGTKNSCRIIWKFTRKGLSLHTE